MGAKADEIKACFVRFAVDQNEIGPDVAVAVILPLAAKGMIEISPGQRLIFRQHGHCFEQLGVESPALPSGSLSFVVAPEAAGVPNTPHSG